MPRQTPSPLPPPSCVEVVQAWGLGMGTGCQAALARAVPSPPHPDSRPLLCCVPRLPYPGSRGAMWVNWWGGGVCVCTRVCPLGFVSLKALETGDGRTPSHGRSHILQFILCLEPVLQGKGRCRHGRSWGWAGVWGGAPGGRKAEADRESPSGAPGRMPDAPVLDPRLASLPLGKQSCLSLLICKIGLIIPTYVVVVSI